MSIAEQVESATVDVLLIDDHVLFAESLTLLLRAQGLHVARCAQLAPTAVVDTVLGRQPRIVVLDLDLGTPYGSSVPLIPSLTARSPVVILTASTDQIAIAEGLEAGACGYVAKSARVDVLVDAITAVLRGRPALARADRTAMLVALDNHRRACRQLDEPFKELSSREGDVLSALVGGLSAEQIAAQRHVAITTVRSQIQAVLRKLGVGSQLAAVALAHRVGWPEYAPSVGDWSLPHAGPSGTGSSAS